MNGFPNNQVVSINEKDVSFPMFLTAVITNAKNLVPILSMKSIYPKHEFYI